MKGKEMEEIRKERRRFPRIDVELFVRYKILSTPQKQFEARTKNISAGGVCLVTREQIEPGTVLAMDIKFPHSSNPALVSGRVIWSAESTLGPSPAGHIRFDNGIEFIQISEQDRQRIIEQVRSAQDKIKAAGWKIGIVRNIPE